MVIFVILMTTIFAGVLINLNRNLSDMPTVIVRNTLMREAENVSDFALRNGIRNANSVAFLNYNFSLQDTIVWPFVNYKVGNCTIDSLKYSYFNGKTNYMVRSYVTGEMQGIKVSRSAELAFKYPFGDAEKPNILNIDVERLPLTIWDIIIGVIHTIIDLLTGQEVGCKTFMMDSSGNAYDAIIYSRAWKSAISSSGGAFNKYCLIFLGGFNSYLQESGATHMYVAPDNSGVAKPIKTGNSFSLMCFAKIDKIGNKFNPDEQGTLMWVPSDPYDATMINKPAAAIWFDNRSSKKKMHFTVTRADMDTMEIEVTHDGGPWNGTRGDIFKWERFLWIGPYYPKLLDHTKYQWNSYGLTYRIEPVAGVSKGVLRAYINGVKVGTRMGNPEPQYVSPDSLAYPYGYGITLGRRDIKTGSPGEQQYKYFMGLMDQIAMNDEAYDDDQMSEWHNTALAPARIMYLRD